MSRRKTESEYDLSWLTPGAVCNLAYCFYLAELKAKVGDGPISHLADHSVRMFKALLKEVPPDSPEGIFLNVINMVVVSLSKGLFRRKQTLAEGLTTAERERTERLRSMSEGNRSGAFFKGALKVLALGGFGFLITKGVIVPKLAESEAAAQPNYLSLAVGVGVAMLSYYCSNWLTQFKVLHVFAIYQQAVDYAYDLYQGGSLEEYERATHGVKEAWKAYFGQLPPPSPDFGTVMREDMEMRSHFKRERSRMLMSYFQMALFTTGNFFAWLANLRPGRRRK